MTSDLTYLKKLELFKELDRYQDGEFFAVVDVSVKNHLPQWIQFSPQVFWLRRPEEDKNLETFGRVVEFFLKQGVHRRSKLFAIGGGATTDFGGFVAATILRGISWTSIPTTLLAMIDGSIGGKVALNMPQGKNLVGAFHEPEKIIICHDFLTSLPESEWMSGKGELLKYGFLSQKIHDLIMKKAPLDEIIRAAAEHKLNVVERDLKEDGERINLNLGHTLGHAFESSLKIPHGQAVGMGMRYLFEIFERSDSLEHWGNLVTALELSPESYDLKKQKNFDLNNFLSFLDQDKKKVDTKVRLVLMRHIGKCVVEEISLKELKHKFAAHVENLT
jgi:3-dehydroquinate synthase